MKQAAHQHTACKGYAGRAVPGGRPAKDESSEIGIQIQVRGQPKRIQEADTGGKLGSEDSTSPNPVFFQQSHVGIRDAIPSPILPITGYRIGQIP